MHIVLVHFEKVPVRLYGGSERVIESLAMGLLELGHKVSLIALDGDYRLAGVNFISLNQFGEGAKDYRNALKLLPPDSDIVHFHLPVGELECEKLGIPYISTLHGNEQHPEKLPKNIIFLTQDHAERHGRKHYVFNGLDVDEATLGSCNIAERRYLSFLGRASLKRKGLHLAKKIAKKCQLPLHIGGGRGISLFGRKYLGHLDNSQKYELLRNSRALLFPILWEEPFGLVLIEAMFSGTPIFALNRGSVPEVLGQPGSEGLFLTADTVEELQDKIEHFKFDHTAAEYREYGKKYFSYQAMAKSYVEKYQLVLAGNSLFNS